MKLKVRHILKIFEKEIIESDDHLVVTYDPSYEESDRKFSIMTSSFGESSMFSTDDINQLKEMRDILEVIIKKDEDNNKKNKKNTNINEKTFDEWNELGYYVIKGSKSRFEDGKFLFSESQVKKKQSFNKTYDDYEDNKTTLTDEECHAMGHYGPCGPPEDEGDGEVRREYLD